MSDPVPSAPSPAPADPAPGAPVPAARRRTLRAALVAVLVTTVAVMCLGIAVVTHLSVRTQLHAELDSQLERAAARALDREVAPADGEGVAPPTSSPGAAPPGSGELELTMVMAGEDVVSASWRDQQGEMQQLPQEDVQELRETIGAMPASSTVSDGAGAEGPGGEGEAQRRQGATAALSIGDYRVIAREAPAPGAADGSSGEPVTVVTGLPLHGAEQTLLRLDATLVIASLAAVLVTGTAGSLIIRRTLRPLAGVAQLASRVATTPLDRGSVTLAERVAPEQSVPGTEVGEVGRALNHLLDNVEGAIETRHRSEEQMRRFIADASHELRTPLTAIRGHTQLLRLTEELGERGRASVERLDAQSARMAALVEDLLLLARLDGGAPPSHEEQVDLGEITLESVMDAQAAAPDHVIEVQVPDEPVTVRGDARQLGQVASNLLSNARKHTPAGTRIAVALRAEGGGEDGAGTAVLEVRDDGPGIDPELLPEVFTRFTRADAARSGSEGTSGLGLPIVQAILAAHGGAITVDSRPGRTVLRVELPREPAGS